MAARNPARTVGHNNADATAENPTTEASQNNPQSALYAIRMKAPRASHDLLCGVNTTRRKRALCSRSQTSNTVVSDVNSSAMVDSATSRMRSALRRPSSIAIAVMASAPEPMAFVQQYAGTCQPHGRACDTSYAVSAFFCNSGLSGG